MRDTNIVDSTLFEQDGRWWLFGGMSRGRVSTTNEELYLFWSDSPLGPWKEHPANPVKSDISSARPAGWPFRYKGQLYRPAQDLSRGENFETVLNRMDVFNEREYRETEVARLRGGWLPGQIGIHTLNHADGLATIDVMVHRPWF